MFPAAHINGQWPGKRNTQGVRKVILQLSCCLTKLQTGMNIRVSEIGACHQHGNANMMINQWI
jgi:hypothetical protein